ncbi:MAG: hypothetical protein J6C40_15795 [Lentisphaeria bacterium]|nr:hypothetical protein [Lentisphaeria bacterium]
MNNYRSLLTRLRWNAGELLSGHQFRIHDFAVKKDSDRIVLLTGLCRNGENYCYICLDNLETETAPSETFRKPASGEITVAYEILKEKLIFIRGYQGQEYWQKLLKKFKSAHNI